MNGGISVTLRCFTGKKKNILLATSSFSHNHKGKVMSVFTLIKFWLFHYCINRITAWQLNAIHLQGGYKYI